MTMIDRPGTVRAHRYRLDGEVGAGGVATAYLARELKHDCKVALMALRPEPANILMSPQGEPLVAEFGIVMSPGFSYPWGRASCRTPYPLDVAAL